MKPGDAEPAVGAEHVGGGGGGGVEVPSLTFVISVTVWVSFEIFSVTMYSPLLAYFFVGFGSVDFVPSPKSHENLWHEAIVHCHGAAENRNDSAGEVQAVM